jgi:hypothetical protein
MALATKSCLVSPLLAENRAHLAASSSGNSFSAARLPSWTKLGLTNHLRHSEFAGACLRGARKANSGQQHGGEASGSQGGAGLKWWASASPREARQYEVSDTQLTAFSTATWFPFRCIYEFRILYNCCMIVTRQWLRRRRLRLCFVSFRGELGSNNLA